MPKSQPQVITTRQAKRQVNIFGFSLVIYIFLNQMLVHGISFLEEYYPAALSGFDPELIIMAFFIVTILITSLVLFRISSALLKLDIKDYLTRPKIGFKKTAILVCIGIAVTYFFTAIASFFNFLLYPSSGDFAFVGHFTSREYIIKNIVYVALFVFIKPYCDEYVFRGVIQRQLGHYNRYFGVIASAFLYAIAQPSLIEAIPAFFTGWFLALITLRYHSIRPARTVHILTALFIWIITILSDTIMIVPAAILLVIYGVAGYSLVSGIRFSILGTGAFQKKLWRILLTSFTIILCIILFIAGIVLSFF